MEDTTVEPSGGVIGPIKRNTGEGRCLLKKKKNCEMLMNASLLFLLSFGMMVAVHPVVFLYLG